MSEYIYIYIYIYIYKIVLFLNSQELSIKINRSFIILFIINFIERFLYKVNKTCQA